jgi:Na+/proline symporter
VTIPSGDDDDRFGPALAGESTLVMLIGSVGLAAVLLAGASSLFRLG